MEYKRPLTSGSNDMHAESAIPADSLKFMRIYPIHIILLIQNSHKIKFPEKNHKTPFTTKQNAHYNFNNDNFLQNKEKPAF